MALRDPLTYELPVPMIGTVFDIIIDHTRVVVIVVVVVVVCVSIPIVACYET